jgi:tryptophan-rich sensory protein
MNVSRRRDVLGLSAFVVLSFGTAALGGIAVARAFPGWYPVLAKPSWTPPVFVFGPTWTLLYALIASAGWLAWRRGRSRLGPLLFLLQLALNLAWPWLFFAARRLDLAFVVVTLLWISVFVLIRVSWRVSRLAALLLVPYLAWLSLAWALNLAIWRMNPR